MAKLAENKNIKVLNLAGNGNINSKAVLELSKSKSIINLNLSNTSIGGIGLEKLIGNNTITSLTADNIAGISGVTRPSDSHLGIMLYGRQAKFTYLSLQCDPDKSSITITGAEMLASFIAKDGKLCLQGHKIPTKNFNELKERYGQEITMICNDGNKVVGFGPGYVAESRSSNGFGQDEANRASEEGSISGSRTKKRTTDANNIPKAGATPSMQRINPKYLDKPRLPEWPSDGKGKSKKPLYNATFTLERCSNSSDNGSGKKWLFEFNNKTAYSVGVDFNSDNPLQQCDVKFVFYSNNMNLPANGNNVIFVFAGRKEKALFPLPSPDCRVILVATKDEYLGNEDKQIKAYQGLVPENVDVLVIMELNSKTNGDYRHDLGSINSRRLAAFMFSEMRGLDHGLFLDDNLKSLAFNKDLSSLGDNPQVQDIYNYLLEQRVKYNNPIIFGAANISNIMDYDYTNKFCAKFHLWDLKALRGELGIVGNRNFYLIYDAKNVNCWGGGDYFFHNFIWRLLQLKNIKRPAFETIDPKYLGYNRCTDEKNSFRRVTRPIRDILNSDIAGVYDDEAINDEEKMFLQARKSAADDSKNIVRNNLENYEKTRNNLEQLDLLKAHANANNTPPGISSTNSASTVKITVYEKLESNLDSFGDKMLRGHQIKALKAILEKHKKNQEDNGLLDMCTGSGKTRVQIFLALTALQLRDGHPIVIVTPTKDLVQQFYNDFIECIEIFNENVNKSEQINWREIIKVMSGVNNISAGLLAMNKDINNKCFVAIFCLDSYKKILNIAKSSDDKSSEEPVNDESLYSDEDVVHEKCELIANAPVLMLDECHMYDSDLAKIKDRISANVIYYFTATPKQNELFGNEPLFKYPLRDGLKDKVIVPLCVKKLGEVDGVITDKKSKNSISCESLYIFMTRNEHPGGGKIIEHKTVVYVNNIEEIHNFANYFAKQNKKCFRIHSHKKGFNHDELGGKDGFHESDGSIAFACDMIGVGYSDNRLDTVISLTNASKDLVKQRSGRAERLDPKNKQKIALIVGFDDIKLDEDIESLIKYSEELLPNSHFQPEVKSAMMFSSAELCAQNRWITPSDERVNKMQKLQHLNNDEITVLPKSAKLRTPSDLRPIVQQSNEDSPLRRKSLQNIDIQRIMQNPNVSLGSAVDDGGCYFDSLAQALNKINGRSEYTEKSLRMLCAQYYEKNQQKVLAMDKADFHEHRYPAGRDYSRVQYTKPESDFLNIAPMWGRSNIEGAILCSALNISKIVIIEIMPEIDGATVVEPAYRMVVADNPETPITQREANLLIEEGNTPVLVVSGLAESSLHYVPLYKKPTNTAGPVFLPVYNSLTNSSGLGGWPGVELQKPISTSLDTAESQQSQSKDTIKEDAKKLYYKSRGSFTSNFQIVNRHLIEKNYSDEDYEIFKIQYIETMWEEHYKNKCANEYNELTDDKKKNWHNNSGDFISKGHERFKRDCVAQIDNARNSKRERLTSTT